MAICGISSNILIIFPFIRVFWLLFCYRLYKPAISIEIKPKAMWRENRGREREGKTEMGKGELFILKN